MIRLALPALLAFAATPAFASFQDTTLIDRAVASFAGQPIGAPGGARAAVDPKLKLAACPMVTMAWHGAVHDAVLVSCPQPAWHIYVPLTVVAPAASAAVATSVTPPPVKPAIVIKRGDPVMVEAQQSGFSISREAVAMGDAAAGQTLMLKGDGDKAPFQAVAVQTGHATLPGF